MRPPINSEKHIRQIPTNEAIAGVNTILALCEAVDTPSVAQHVRVGAVVKAVYIEIWLSADSAQLGSVTATVEKLVGGNAGASFTDMATLQDYPNKKNILFTTQGLTPDNNGNPVPFIRMWIKIPKGKQRFGLGDNLVLNLSSNNEGLDHCGLAIFKEYF